MTGNNMKVNDDLFILFFLTTSRNNSFINKEFVFCNEKMFHRLKLIYVRLRDFDILICILKFI